MNMISNPDGTISTSRLFNVITWICVLLKFMLPDIFGALDSGTAAALLSISNSAYVARTFTQGKHGKSDPRGQEA